MERYDKKVALKYENPVVPTGYKHILGEWNTGFVIQRENDGSLLTWVPVGCLKANGTLDGVSFTEKFGRRKFLPDVFSEYSYHESMIPELISQVESIKKYEGFYISSCNISKNKNGITKLIKMLDMMANKNRDHETDFYFQKDVCCRYSDRLSDGILFGNGTANAATQCFTRNKQ